MIREEPGFEDYLAAGALANVPLWIYFLLLTLDTNSFSQSNPTLFFTLIPIGAMIGGGALASCLLCRRSRRRFIRIGLLVGVTGAIVNFVFGLAASAPSTALVSAICFVTSGVAVGVLWGRQHME